MDYFFSAQIRQYRLQLIRAFSNFSVNVGTEDAPKLKRVPCRYGDTSRIAETIITGNSENKIPSAPFISVYVTGMALSPERRAAPSLVSTVNVNERAYDGDHYLNTSGNRYTVKRIMPVPFVMTVNVDFWTSNLNQKEELFEQTQVLFNGMVDMQTSNNPLDWTLFSTIEPTNITWSSRTIPIGTDNPIDVMTVEYRIPIWINPPAQVTYQKAIQQIVTNISSGDINVTNMEWQLMDLLEQRIVTPDQARIQLKLIDDYKYEISLRDVGGSNQDLQHLSTVIVGAQTMQLLPGTSFSVNGKPITIPNNNVDDLLTIMQLQLQSVYITAHVNVQNRLVLTNTQGGNIELANINGAPVQALGFIPTVYVGGTLAWWRLLEQYGTLRDQLCDGGTSYLHLLTSTDLDARQHDVIGTIQLHPVNQNLLIWTVDANTWPQSTMPAIDAVIDPQSVFPGAGLPPVELGQRYLIVNEIAQMSAVWGQVQANAHDIIQFDGAQWIRAWDHMTSTNQTEWVKNKFSQKWYKWESDGWQVWPQDVMPGYWRLRL